MNRLSLDKRRQVAEQCIHYNLKRATRVVTQGYDEALKPTGLHIAQFTLLVSASLTGPIGLSELAERLTLDQTTLSRNVQPLIKRGLLKLEPNKEDRRSRLVVVTAKGEATIAEAYPKWLEAQTAFDDALGASGHKNLLNSTHLLAGEQP